MSLPKFGGYEDGDHFCEALIEALKLLCIQPGWDPVADSWRAVCESIGIDEDSEVGLAMYAAMLSVEYAR